MKDSAGPWTAATLVVALTFSPLGVIHGDGTPEPEIPTDQEETASAGIADSEATLGLFRSTRTLQQARAALERGDLDEARDHLLTVALSARSESHRNEALLGLASLLIASENRQGQALAATYLEEIDPEALGTLDRLQGRALISLSSRVQKAEEAAADAHVELELRQAEIEELRGALEQGEEAGSELQEGLERLREQVVALQREGRRKDAALEALKGELEAREAALRRMTEAVLEAGDRPDR